MLPVSGAEQLNTSADHNARPMISHSGAYSRLVRPAPLLDSGRNRFQRPAARAFAVIQGYGLTETAPIVTVTHPFNIRAGSVGKAIPGVDVMIAISRICVRRERASSAVVSFELTAVIVVPMVDIEPGGSMRSTGQHLSPTPAIQGSASVLGVHARTSGSPMRYANPGANPQNAGKSAVARHESW